MTSRINISLGLIAPALVWFVAIGAIFAQTGAEGSPSTKNDTVRALHPTGPLPSFEVATIKPISPTGSQMPAPPPLNVFRIFGVTARMLIGGAYGLPPGARERVIGGPEWIDDDRYQVDAKIPDALFAEMQKMTPMDRQNQNLLMTQSLLLDRFKLKVHFDTREMPIYELVVAKGGSKLTPAKEAAPESGAPPPRPGNPRPKDMREGIMVLRKPPATVEMTARGVTLDMLKDFPGFGLGGSPVVNKTGLTGKYDFVLDWAMDQPATPGSDTPVVESDAPPLFTALEEQLGLKLVKTKGPVEVVVIDSIERPSAN